VSYVNSSFDRFWLRKSLEAPPPKRQSNRKLEVIYCVGGICSPTLANMTLDGLEALLAQHFPGRSGRRATLAPKVNLVRYADDFIVTGDSKELLEDKVRPLVEQFLKNEADPLSDKTRITISTRVRLPRTKPPQIRRKPLVKPSKKNTHAFLEKVRAIIDTNKSVSQPC